MPIPFDFLRLYEELGLAADASLDELKRAYRRRVSELHPDRPPQGNAAAARRAEERLQQLTVMYAAATDFHRRHGRLPGSPGATRHPLGVRARAPMHAISSPPPRRSRKFLWFALLAAAGGWLLLNPLPEETHEEATFATAPNAVSPSRVHEPKQPVRTALVIGMTTEDVLALQGAPMTRGGDRWHYGPSWIAFDADDKVSDWYSSPLRPLKVARTRSTPP